MPKISVCVAAYNHARFIDKSLQSILHQTWRDLEVVVVDDASTDGTSEVVKQCADARVRLYRNEKNLGAAPTYNRAMQLAEGEYIYTFPSDDEMLPTNLEEKVAVLDARPEIGLVYSDSYFTDAEGNITGTYMASEGYRPVRGRLNADLIVTTGMLVCGHTPMRRASCLKQVGYFDSSLKHAHDGDQWLRIAGEFPLEYIPRPLVTWRIHGANLHGRGDPVEYLERAQVVKRITEKYPQIISPRLRDLVMATSIAQAGLQVVARDLPQARHYFVQALRVCPYHVPALVWYANSFLRIKSLWDHTLYKRLFLQVREILHW